MADIKAMPDVVWPSAEASALRSRCQTLADLIESQLITRRDATTVAEKEWLGAYRAQFDSTYHAPNLANAQMLIANLRAMTGSIDQVESWVQKENAARQQAREREHDDETWGGAKKYWNELFG